MDPLSRRLSLKSKLQKRAPVFAGWTSFGHPGPTEIFTRAGFDVIGLDLEHSTISQAEAQRLIAAAHAGGVACLPRIASHDPQMARRLLDSGADGIIVPMVNSKQDVALMIDWVKYPPVGKRGFGVGRAQGYGADFSDYTKTWNDSSVIIAQIESITAVGSIDAILDHPHLDGVMVGPYDISGSLNVPGQLDHPSVVEAGLKVVKACQQMGKSCATQIIAPDQEQIRLAFDRGYTMLVLASDVFILNRWAQEMKKLI